MASRFANSQLRSSPRQLVQRLRLHILSARFSSLHSFSVDHSDFLPNPTGLASHPSTREAPSLLWFSRSHSSFYLRIHSYHGAAAPRCMHVNLWTPFCLINSSHLATQHTDSSIQCWSCGEKNLDKSSLTCPSCNVVQSVDDSIDYFQLFDQDRKYELDLKDLEGKYKNLMRRLHPDLFHRKSEEEQVNSANLAAIVTRAYNELLKPVSRATYLLKLQGIHVEEEGTVNDPELISEVMEIKETLEQTSDEKTLRQLYDTAKTRMDDWVLSFTTALKEGNPNAAVAAVQRMSYFNRVFEDVRLKLL